MLVGYASSAVVGTGACLVSGSVGVLLWNWAAANLRLHARVGEVSAKLEARLYCICADFMGAIAEIILMNVLHVKNQAHAA
jgi:hypothetical protein